MGFTRVFSRVFYGFSRICCFSVRLKAEALGVLPPCCIWSRCQSMWRSCRRWRPFVGFLGFGFFLCFEVSLLGFFKGFWMFLFFVFLTLFWFLDVFFLCFYDVVLVFGCFFLWLFDVFFCFWMFFLLVF